MIGRIKGIILEKKAPELLVDVNGIGYEIFAPMSTFYQLPEVGATTTLHTHFVVREDVQQLYGFAKLIERDLFRLLIKVNGVGPKLALAILSSMEPDNFIQCIANNDTASLVRLPGIGKKTAERLIIEIADKLKDWVSGGAKGAEPIMMQGNFAAHDSLKDAMSALVTLGYKPQQASQVISKIDTQGLSTEGIIKQALKQLG